MPKFNLVTTIEDPWLPDEALALGLRTRYLGTRIGYDLVPRSPMHLYASVPDPLPDQNDHTLSLEVNRSCNMVVLEDASPEGAAEIMVWIVRTFPAPPGAEIMIWSDDESLTLDPETVTVTDILVHFDYD